jgi:hypothetical protein
MDLRIIMPLANWPLQGLGIDVKRPKTADILSVAINYTAQLEQHTTSTQILGK